MGGGFKPWPQSATKIVFFKKREKDTECSETGPQLINVFFIFFFPYYCFAFGIIGSTLLFFF